MHPFAKVLITIVGVLAIIVLQYYAVQWREPRSVWFYCDMLRLCDAD